jgi:hypothetical protein
MSRPIPALFVLLRYAAFRARRAGPDARERRRMPASAELDNSRAPGSADRVH